MSTNTTNLNLVKPADGEAVDIDVINGNMDIIDEVVGTFLKVVPFEELVGAHNAGDVDTTDVSIIQQTGYSFIGIVGYDTATSGLIVRSLIPRPDISKAQVSWWARTSISSTVWVRVYALFAKQ